MKPIKTSNSRAPESLPAAVSDLVAEGGNVLASDDALVAARNITYVLIRRLQLNKSGRWIARAPKS